MIKCLLSRPGLIAGPLHSTPLPNNSQLILRLDPIDSKSSGKVIIFSSISHLRMVYYPCFIVTLSLCIIQSEACFTPLVPPPAPTPSITAKTTSTTSALTPKAIIFGVQNVQKFSALRHCQLLNGLLLHCSAAASY